MKAPNWFRISEQWLYYSLIAMVASALIYISIPSGAQFKYDYRLGQIWLEEDLVAHRILCFKRVTKNWNRTESSSLKTRTFTTTIITAWTSGLPMPTLILRFMVSSKYGRKGEWCPISPALNHRLYLVDGTRIDLSGAWTPSSLVANYGLPER